MLKIDQTFSSNDLVIQCLADEKRTRIFRQAIEKAVKPGDTVLDVGTGSGILALFAARAGAKRVIAVEYDPYVTDLARQNIEENDFGKAVELIVEDARNLRLANHAAFDVVLMEMLTTGMVDECQIEAINNLHARGYVKDSTIFIPEVQETYLSLTQMNFEVEGLNMRTVRHLWEPFPDGGIQEMTSRKLLSAVPFNRQNDTNFSWARKFLTTKRGTINSVCITSTSLLGNGLSIADTLSLNAPVVVPLAEDLLVGERAIVECKIRYQFGGGYRNFVAWATVAGSK